MDALNIIVWLVIGGLVGLIVTLLVRTETRVGMIVDVLIGVLGGFVGGFLLNSLNWMGPGLLAGVNVSGAIVAIVGAIIFLIAVELYRRSSQ